MQLGMVGAGRMGANMVRRLLKSGHQCVVFDHSAAAIAELVKVDASGAISLADLVKQLESPKIVCLMVPVSSVDGLLDELQPLLSAGDIVIDAGNSHYQDDLARAARLALAGIHYVDLGTSGGVWGLERGYCLMIGGETKIVEYLEPLFRSLAPGSGTQPRTVGREPTLASAEQGYLHCGPNGAGHFVKMIHNGIEYGMMAAYAEGFNILKSANLGSMNTLLDKDAETSPLKNPEFYKYDFNIADVAEVWRRGSVISSWLLDLTAQALHGDQDLASFTGRVSDSGEGRWTIAAADDLGVPAYVLTAALYERFASRDLALFQNKILSAMRFGFGGHLEKKV